MEDECRLQMSTDGTFVDHMNKEFGKNDVYKRCKSRDPVFTIEHYAGQVSWEFFFGGGVPLIVVTNASVFES